MLSPLPRRSGWARYFAHSPSRISLPRYGSRVGLCIVLFEACSAFTRVTACTLALSPSRDTLTEGFSHFVTSMTAPVASGWSGCRVGLIPTGKRRLSTAHARNGLMRCNMIDQVQPERPPRGGSPKSDQAAIASSFLRLPAPNKQSDYAEAAGKEWEGSRKRSRCNCARDKKGA
jgi:hypothetical protein